MDDTDSVHATCTLCGHDLNKAQYDRIMRDPAARKWTCNACGELITDAQSEGIDKELREKHREAEIDKICLVAATSVAGGIAAWWVPPISRHGGNLEILRFELRWLLATGALWVPVAVSVWFLKNPLIELHERTLHKLWVRYFANSSTRTPSRWDSGWRLWFLIVGVNFTFWPLIIIAGLAVLRFIRGD